MSAPAGRPRKENARKARTYKLPPALIARMEERCRKLGMERTAFVERAIEAALGGSTSAASARLEAGHRAPASPPAPAPDPGALRAEQFRQAAMRRRPG